MTAPVSPRTHRLIVLLLILDHLAGLVGLWWPLTAPLFRFLIPLNLVASLALLLWYHRDWRPAFWFYALTAVLVGFFVEVLGVATGVIFGHYAYGPALGPHLLNVPPVIGLNWLMLTYCAGSVCNRLPLPVWLKTAVAATLLVALDVFIEPVAVHFDFWTWFGQPVPMLNYAGWWVVSLTILSIWFGATFEKNNRLAGWLLGCQAGFFVGHTIILHFV